MLYAIMQLTIVVYYTILYYTIPWLPGWDPDPQRRKPSAWPARRALERLGVAPEEAPRMIMIMMMIIILTTLL